jgi:hypothetical protein
MNEERTGKCLQQVEHIRGHLRRMYSTDKLYHIMFLSTPHLKTADLIIYVVNRRILSEGLNVFFIKNEAKVT